MIEIFVATDKDFATLAEIMFLAVRRGRSPYTERQRAAWLPKAKHGPEWKSRLESQIIFLAKWNQKPIGFMSLTEAGYVDLAFILPEGRGKGVFRQLHESVETQARKNHLQRLWTHGSLMARPAFEAVGYRAVKEEAVQVENESLTRFEMEKHLVGNRRCSENSDAI
jgi:putative acetyltransferase